MRAEQGGTVWCQVGKAHNVGVNDLLNSSHSKPCDTRHEPSPSDSRPDGQPSNFFGPRTESSDSPGCEKRKYPARKNRLGIGGLVRPDLNLVRFQHQWAIPLGVTVRWAGRKVKSRRWILWGVTRKGRSRILPEGEDGFSSSYVRHRRIHRQRRRKKREPPR